MEKRFEKKPDPKGVRLSFFVSSCKIRMFCFLCKYIEKIIFVSKN